ncbi:MAG TPA: PEP-CTERM sorting domain-containing protein [Candidatus Acidoferrum sp.]|nr:PEP-CTERM sorting domain-containing protein [Candidatus Acidoferrum sp.]
MKTPITHPILKQNLKFTILLAAFLPVSLAASPTTVSQVVEADKYVSSGQPTVNFGSMGAMMIAVPTAAQPRTEESLIRFNTASIKSTLDADYGAGNWTITSITLSLFSNFSTAGQQPGNSSFNKIAAGGFEFDWLSNDSWSETAITWNNLSTVLPGTGGNTSASLGAYYWTADGSTSQNWTLNLDPNLVNDIDTGDKVTIFGQPTAGSTVGYLFNTLNNNPAVLNVAADLTPVPEPSALAMAAGGLAGGFAVRRWRRQK